MELGYSDRGIRYAERVCAGEIPAGELVRLACKRHLDDLQRVDWKYHFDPARGDYVCEFLEELQHVEGGPWPTATLRLEDWQCFLITVVFGWIDAEGFRRFRKAYLEVPRKNGKSYLAAAIALYMLCADGELGAKVYSAAVTREQAGYSWKVAHTMVDRDPEMQDYFGVKPLAHSITVSENAASFKALSRDSLTAEGLNPHGVIIDELHAHKTREVWDVLNLATGARRQSLIFAITTAGDNKAGVCYEQHEYVEHILRGRHEDESYFGLIYTLDLVDDWTSLEAAKKANPNFGISVIPEDLRTLCLQAQRSAQSQNSFMTKRLNIWVSVGTAYFNMLAWRRKCAGDSKLEDFEGERCFAALDLASKDDVAAKMLLFKKDGKRYAFGKYYIPETAIEKGNNPNYDLYSGWARAGLVTVTPGEIIDFEFIEEDLIEDRNKFQVVKVGYDPFQATELSTRMRKESIPMWEVGATVRNFSEPMKTLGGWILQGDIIHCGDPVLDWMMGNVYGKLDAKDNVYPRKTRVESKIDGAVCLIMVINLALADAAGPSVYETRGLRRV